MSCRLKNHTLVPPEGFKYRQPETGVTRDGQSLSATISLVMEHRQANGLGRQTHEEVEEDVNLQICQRVPDSFCNGGCSVVGPGRVTRDQILSGIHAIASMVSSLLAGENPFVDQVEAERRAGICANCFLNDRGGYKCSGCSFTGKLRDAMGITIGERTTAKDGALEVCRVCGCLNKVTVWFSANILRETMSADLRAKFAQVPRCWRAEL